MHAKELRSQAWPAETAPKAAGAAPPLHTKRRQPGCRVQCGCSSSSGQAERAYGHRSAQWLRNRPARRYGCAFGGQGTAWPLLRSRGRACWLKGAADMVAAFSSGRVRNLPAQPRTHAPQRGAALPAAQLQLPIRAGTRGAPRRPARSGRPPGVSARFGPD